MPRKNYKALIEAFSLVKQKNPQLKLIIVGKEGTQAEEVKVLPNKLGTSESVIFTGAAPEEDLPALYSGAALYISTSVEEGFGLTLLEAMSCETPCAVSDIPSFRETSQGTVEYFNPLDTKSIADTIERCLSSYEPEKVIKAKNRAAEFTWEKCAKETLRVVESVVKGF